MSVAQFAAGLFAGGAVERVDGVRELQHREVQAAVDLGWLATQVAFDGVDLVAVVVESGAVAGEVLGFQLEPPVGGRKIELVARADRGCCEDPAVDELGADRIANLIARLDELQRLIERARIRWFWSGVLCGIGGVYLGYAIARALGS